MVLNFSWLIQDRVAGMARPRAENASWLTEQGIAGILSLTERAPDGLEGQFELLHLPVPDMTAPDLDVLARGVAFMRAVLARDEAVVVHCTAGLGRTGTLLAAYLVADGLDADQAIATVRALRPGSIETREQEQILGVFADALHGGTKR